MGIASVAGGLPAIVLAGSKAARGTLAVTVRGHDGAAFGGPVTLTAVASEDGVADAGDMVIGSVVRSLRLGAGAAKTVKLKLQLPASAVQGNKTVLVTAAAGGAAATASAGTCDVQPAFVRLAGLPAGAAPTPLTLGRRSTLSIPLQNLGTVPTAKSPATYTLIVSTDGTEAGAVFETTAAGKVNLKPNAAKPQKLAVTFPAGAFAPGAYTLLVKVRAELNTSDGEVVAALPLTFV